MLHYCSYVSYRKTENSNGDKHMNDDKDTVNYMDSINKASRKRRRKPSFWEQYGILVIGAAVLAVIVVAVVFGGKAVNAVKGKWRRRRSIRVRLESESAEEASSGRGGEPCRDRIRVGGNGCKD